MTFSSLLGGGVWLAVLLRITPDVARQSHMTVDLSAGILGGFARDEHQARAWPHLWLAAGAVSDGGDHRAVPVAATRWRSFPVDGEIPPSPHLLHLSLDLQGKKHVVCQKP